MKVLYLVTDDWYFLSHRLHLARAARDAGFEVVVATAPGDRVGEIEAEGFRHLSVRFRRTVATQVANLPLIARLTRLYREEAPDLVHHVSFLPIVFGSLAASRAGVPAVVNAVTGLGHAFVEGSAARRALRFGVERAYAVALRRPNSVALFQNQDDRRLFVERDLVDPDRTLCVPGSGVDIERFKPDARVLARSPAASDGLRILHASRMLFSKGVGVSVEAARLLKERGLAHHLVLAGRTHASNPESIPEAQLADWEQAGLATWIGDCEDMPALLARTDVVALPTLYREGVPMVLLEAAAAGLPIVTTDVPGCRDLVRHQDNGLLVGVRDARALADAIEELARDPKRARAMGLRGRAQVEARFSKELVIDATLAGYRRLLAPHWPTSCARDPASVTERLPNAPR